MSKTLKIFLIVLGLGVFILPKQMIYAQSPVECCAQKPTKEECCKKEVSTCSTDHSKSKSDKDHCGDDCTQCNSCTVNFVMNYLSPGGNFVLTNHSFSQRSHVNYSNSYYSSNFQNIWQPPKIG